MDKNALRISATQQVYSLDNLRALLIVGIFVIGAIALPALCHLLGLPVRWLLPMHWTIILAGMLYGWRGGLIAGALAPLTNYILTGYPLPIKILPMTGELVIYGALTGWLIEIGWNRFLAIATALITGRLIFIMLALLTNATDGLSLYKYISIAMLPGLVGGLFMILFIPLIVKWLKRFLI